MKLLKLSTGAAMLLALPACTATQTTGSDLATINLAPAATLQRVETTGPALWKVADEDTTVYLFGTVHFLPNDTQWMTPAIQQALASSDTMVTEILMAEMGDAAMQQKMMAIGMLPQGETLRSLLTDQHRATYEAALQKLNIPPAAFDQFKPWTAAMTLSIVPLLQQGYNPEAGVEKALERAAGADLERGALETVDQQLAMFDTMPRDAQIAYLVETAEQAEEIKPMLDRMVAAWVAGNPDQLAEIMNEGLEGNEQLAERLLYARNRDWAEWIDARLDQPGTVFMAVGAGHLAGENSVQDYLLTRNIAVAR